MRARVIKPAFFDNESLADCSTETRLLFIGLWCIADREGRLEDRPRKIKAEVFPYDNFDTEILLEQLQKNGLIIRYEADGIKCIMIPNFLKHQKPHSNEVESTLPPCQKDLLPRSEGLATKEESTSSLYIDPCTLNIEHSTKKHITPSRGNDYPPEFESFWSVYPRKVEKPGAFKVWQRVSKNGSTPEQLLSAAKNYAEDMKQKGRLGTEYVKHAATFLGPKGAYLDYINRVPLTVSAQPQPPSDYNPYQRL